MVAKPYLIVRAQEVPEYKQNYIIPNKEYVCFDYDYSNIYGDIGAGKIIDEEGMLLIILLGKPCPHLNQNMWEIVDV